MTKKKSSNEQYIVTRGSHSRIESEVKVRYHAGDLIDVSPEERERFPGKFMLLSVYDARVEDHERMRAEEQAKMRPPRLKRDEARAPAAVKRSKKLLEMQRKSERRITL